jgi:LuxR family maltose regulon positive regulatory protein
MQQFQALLDGGISPTTRAQLARLAYEGKVRLSLLEAPSQDGVLALRALIALYRHDGDDLHALKLSVQLVEALALLGRDDEAGAELLASLKTGMQSGVFQLFLCGSAILYEKLKSLYSRELSTAGGHAELRPYVASLIGREHERVVAKVGAAGMASKSSITVREREILLRMSHGHSNKKIARDLGIGPETVKSHAKRIFFKLGVTKRIEAVTCASDLSLI